MNHLLLLVSLILLWQGGSPQGSLPQHSDLGGPASSSNLTIDTAGKTDTGNVKINGKVSDSGPKEIGFGEWMILTRKPKWPNRPSGPFKSEAQPQGFKYQNNQQNQQETDRVGLSKLKIMAQQISVAQSHEIQRRKTQHHQRTTILNPVHTQKGQGSHLSMSQIVRTCPN